MNETDNPYAVVKETTTTEYEGDVKVSHTKGYDAKGRIVLVATYREYPNGTNGHCVSVVEKDGYWDGGAFDPIIGTGCQFARKKFIEGEVS